MLKKTIKYTNFNDEEVEEDFYFHLSKAELVELELSREGGLKQWLETIIATEDGKEIISEFKKIILSAYGKRSEDGRQFIKNQALRDEFESTEAYSVLFMELVTDMEAGIVFVNGIIPKGLAEEAAKIAKTENEPKLEAVPDDKPDPEIIHKVDIVKMSQEELIKLGGRVNSGEVIIAD